MELLKMLSASEILAQILSFFLLLFLLRIFAWKKILGLLDQRKEKISSQLSEIENTKLEVAKLKADYESKISNIAASAQEKINAAVEQAKIVSMQMRKKAHEEAQDIIIDARQQVKYEVTKVQEQLKERIVDIALDAARSVIQEKLTEDGDRKIVEDFIREVEKA
ncbi:MAG TPA: F0F1 ATP synthase subunit B [Candidatus Omnitrophota bacterium]|nr:F0F1 ATP synthase subunit B [Candidatus Omnitrophota bacterium]HPT38994.1 F0F1 ATP synthase subunit B [Candidatus Omnitrophota bacterium]